MRHISKEIFIQKLLSPGLFTLIDCSKEPLSLKNTEIFSSQKEYPLDTSIFFSFDTEILNKNGYIFISKEKSFFKKHFST